MTIRYERKIITPEFSFLSKVSTQLTSQKWNNWTRVIPYQLAKIEPEKNEIHIPLQTKSSTMVLYNTGFNSPNNNTPTSKIFPNPNPNPTRFVPQMFDWFEWVIERMIRVNEWLIDLFIRVWFLSLEWMHYYFLYFFFLFLRSSVSFTGHHLLYSSFLCCFETRASWRRFHHFLRRDYFTAVCTLLTGAGIGIGISPRTSSSPTKRETIRTVETRR